jgi:hypothetical protein
MWKKPPKKVIQVNFDLNWLWVIVEVIYIILRYS